MRDDTREHLFVWLLPSVALVLAAACALTCAVAYVHFARVDAAFPVDGRGILRARPPEVRAASRLLGLTWLAALPVAVVVTLLSAVAQDRFRAEGGARTFAHLVTMTGVAACVGGAILAGLGFFKILA